MIKFRKIILGSLILLVGLVFAGGCIKKNNPKLTDNNVSVNSNVQPGEVAILDSDIIVNKPLSYSKITSPVIIQGRAAPILKQIEIQLLDAFENKIATTTVVIADGESLLDFFSVELNFGRPNSPQGWLEVFSVNEQNNNIENLIRLPVLFDDYQKPTVKVFFSNIKQDPEVKDCSKVYFSVREIEFNQNPIIGALEQLLSGPTQQEMKDGFVDNLPEDVKVQKIELQDGVLTVDFSQALQEGVGGSCRVLALRAQIVETLKQFENVSEVVIAVDGETESILQP